MTGQLMDLTIHGLQEHLTDGRLGLDNCFMFDFFKNSLLASRLVCKEDDQSANWLTASWFVGESSGKRSCR